MNMRRITLAQVIPALFWCLLGSPASGESIQLSPEGGTYLIPVRINGTITLPFVLDSGAADVMIPADVVSTLIRSGTVEPSNFIGKKKYVLADGSELPSLQFVIRELAVGKQAVQNVIASVAPAQANHPLLGQSFLSKLPRWSIDNERQTLVFGEERNKPPDRQKRPAASANASGDTEIAVRAARDFDATYSQGGMAGVNVRVAECYQRAKKIRSIAQVEDCFIVDVLGSRIEAAFYRDILKRPEPADDQNSFSATELRLAEALSTIGADPRQGDQMISEWIKIANLAESLAGAIAEHRNH